MRLLIALIVFLMLGFWGIGLVVSTYSIFDEEVIYEAECFLFKEKKPMDW